MEHKCILVSIHTNLRCNSGVGCATQQHLPCANRNALLGMAFGSVAATCAAPPSLACERQPGEAGSERMRINYPSRPKGVSSAASQAPSATLIQPRQSPTHQAATMISDTFPTYALRGDDLAAYFRTQFPGYTEFNIQVWLLASTGAQRF